MRLFRIRNSRVIILLLLLIAFSGVGIKIYLNNQKLDLPSKEFVYNIDNNRMYLELEDYVVEENIITHKATGASRRIFTDEFGKYEKVLNIYGDGNKIYYGTNKGFFCYDVENDTTKCIYEHLVKPIEIEVFDVRVFYRVMSREEIETYAETYVIYDNRLIIDTNKAVLMYDGKDTKELVRGDYSLISYENGVLTLRKYYSDGDKGYEDIEIRL